MSLRVNTNVRNDASAAFLTRIGNAGKGKFYNGARPTNVGDAPAGTLLATVVFGSPFGTSSAGVINIDEAGITQTAASHVSGTPTYIVFTTSADVAVGDLDVGGGAGQLNVTGTIQTGVNITFGTSTITAP